MLGSWYIIIAPCGLRRPIEIRQRKLSRMSPPKYSASGRWVANSRCTRDDRPLRAMEATFCSTGGLVGIPLTLTMAYQSVRLARKSDHSSMNSISGSKSSSLALPATISW